MYLWTAITNYLDNFHEDENYNNLQQSLLHGKIGGAPAKTRNRNKKSRDQTQERHASEHSPVSVTPAKKGKGKRSAFT